MNSDLVSSTCKNLKEKFDCSVFSFFNFFNLSDPSFRSAIRDFCSDLFTNNERKFFSNLCQKRFSLRSEFTGSMIPFLRGTAFFSSNSSDSDFALKSTLKCSSPFSDFAIIISPSVSLSSLWRSQALIKFQMLGRFL